MAVLSSYPVAPPRALNDNSRLGALLKRLTKAAMDAATAYPFFIINVFVWVITGPGDKEDQF